jgi:hypothetical protein
MKKSMVFATLLAFAALPALAQTADVAGTWDITVNSPRGEMTNPMTIVQDGEKITVTMTNPRGEATGQGTVKGNDIEWSVVRTTPRGEFTVVYKGTVNGNTMSGQAQMGDFGSMDWKAVKK